MNLYRNESSYPKPNAQRNLSGRTHYADDDTLRYFKSRILSSGHTDGGLLFYVLESCAADYKNSRRVYRGVVFDVYGDTVYRPDLDASFKTSDAARKAMWKELNSLDAVEITRKALESRQRHLLGEIETDRQHLEAIAKGIAA